MAPVVGFVVTFNYAFYRNGELHPIEGCFINQMTDQKTIITFDNRHLQTEGGDKSANRRRNKRVNGLPEDFNGHATINYFCGQLMRAYMEMEHEAVVENQLFVACATFQDELILKRTKFPVYILEGVTSLSEVTEMFPPLTLEDQHKYVHDTSELCCRNAAYLLSEYLKRNESE